MHCCLVPEGRIILATPTETRTHSTHLTFQGQISTLALSLASDWPKAVTKCLAVLRLTLSSYVLREPPLLTVRHDHIHAPSDIVSTQFNRFRLRSTAQPLSRDIHRTTSLLSSLAYNLMEWSYKVALNTPLIGYFSS